MAFKDENEQRSEPGEGGVERHALNCRGSPLQSSNQSITVFNCMKIVTSSRNRVYTCKIKAPHRRNVKAIPQSPKAPVPQQHREKKKGKSAFPLHLDSLLCVFAFICSHRKKTSFSATFFKAAKVHKKSRNDKTSLARNNDKIKIKKENQRSHPPFALYALQQ